MFFEEFILSLIKIVGILFVAWVLTRIVKIIISKYLRKFVEQGISGLKKSRKVKVRLEQERLHTLEKVIISILRTVIWVIAIITALPELGVNIGPLLAGLGVGGLALGFGARSLIADYISGLFMLIEDHFRVGEDVQAAGIKGRVISFNLRRTVIKDEEGRLNFVPNSQIKQVANLSRK